MQCRHGSALSSHVYEKSPYAGVRHRAGVQDIIAELSGKILFLTCANYMQTGGKLVLSLHEASTGTCHRAEPRTCAISVHPQLRVWAPAAPSHKEEPETQRSWITQGDPGTNEIQSQVHLRLGSSLHTSCDSFLPLVLDLCIGKWLSASWLPVEGWEDLLDVWADSWVNRSLGFHQERRSEAMTRQQHLGLPTLRGTCLGEEKPV